MIEKELKIRLETMGLKELVNFITEIYHEPLRKNLKKIDELIFKINSNYLDIYPELEKGNILYQQFKTEILKHLTKEDFVVFPSILKFEKIYNDNLIDVSDDFNLMNKLINDIQMTNEHHEFNLYLNSLIDGMEESRMNSKKIGNFELVKELLISIRKDNILHSNIENEYLYSKGIELQNKLIEKLN